MRSKHSKGGNMAMALIAFFLHFSQNIADDPAVVIFGDVKKLRPGKNVVEVVLHLVILWEAKEVAGLHGQKVVYGCFAYADHGWTGDRRFQRNRRGKLGLGLKME